MKSMFKTIVQVLMVLTLSCGLVFAQEAQKAAAKASILIVSTHTVPPDPNGVTFVSPWLTVLSTQITPPGGKDLFIGFSAQTTLADLSNQSATGFHDGPVAQIFTEELNYIQARVLVDGVEAPPGEVLYDALIRTLRATLATPIITCREVAEAGPGRGVVLCTFGSDFLNELIQTTGVHSFNFIMRDVSPANHVIVAPVRFVATNFLSSSSASSNSAIAALIGASTLKVEQVALDPQ